MKSFVVCERCGKKVENPRFPYCAKCFNAVYQWGDKKEKTRLYNILNKDKVAKYQKKYYDKNKEKLAEYQRNYRQANTDKFNAYWRKYREEHKDQLAIYRKAYYEKNKEHRLAYLKQWRAKKKAERLSNPETKESLKARIKELEAQLAMVMPKEQKNAL